MVDLTECPDVASEAGKTQPIFPLRNPIPRAGCWELSGIQGCWCVQLAVPTSLEGH